MLTADEKIALKNFNYKKIMELNTGGLFNAMALIKLGFFKDAEKKLIKYKSKNQDEYEELSYNLQMLELYRKLLNLKNNFAKVTQRLLNENVKRKDIIYGNMALDCLGSEESKELLEYCIDNFGSDFSKFSYENDLAFITKDVNLINKVLKETCFKKNLYMSNYANAYKGLILQNRKILSQSLNIFRDMGCLPDLEIFKGYINNTIH